MAKYLKKYNPITEQWEIISGGDTTVIQVHDSGTPIMDTSVKISASGYTNGDEPVNLADVLDKVDSDISRLQRNVSWLAEHGGGGGNGGSGGGNTYGIELVSPTLTNNATYVSDDTLTIKFRITGGTSSDTFRYRYTLDSVNTSSYVAVNNDELVTITIPSLSALSNSTTHTILIEALNPYGLNMGALSFRIYESSLSMVLSQQANNISNGEVLISRDDLTGNIYFDIKNGVEGSQTTLHIDCNNKSYTTTYENTKTDKITEPLSFWELVDRNTVASNGRYTVSYYAQATLGTTVNNTTDPSSFDVRITNPNNMSIYLDGVSYAENVASGDTATSVAQNDNLFFSFKVYLPSIVTNNSIRYAIWLISPQGETINLFNTSADNSTSASTTIQNYAKQSIPLQIPLSEYEIGNGWQIGIKAWSFNGTLTATVLGQFDIVQPNANIFPRQFPKRYSTMGTVSADTCLFAWDNTSKWNNETNELTSSVKDYMPCTDTKPINTIAYMTAYGIDGSNSGRITPSSGDITHLRLQNEAYAVADMSGYESEIKYLTNSANNNGFTFSVTFKSDVHTDASKTVFLWGTNNSNGELFNGIRITLEQAVWRIFSDNGGSKTITASLRQGVKNTVDFLYDKNNGKAFIYVNGVMNTSADVGTLYTDESYCFPTKAYFATDYINGQYTAFSDINLYNFSVYTSTLNALQLVVNGKNARLDGSISTEDVIAAYNVWKLNNLIYTNENHPEKALSYLIDSDGNYKYDSNDASVIQKVAPIPTIFIDANGSSFTKEVFHGDYSNNLNVTAITYNCTIEYYDPETRKTVSFNAKISLQGTSTLGYYIKNIEIIVDEICSDDNQKYKLFQPKATWFPEREFTLKADVVDSAHANNATIGYWINHECGIMENNPAMNAMTDDFRPKDRVSATDNHFHTDSRTGANEINYDEKVTIKHTLEGFPVIVFIRFDGSNQYDLIGIYSFNLGRASYFNMGMSFLKEFSRRAIDNPSMEVDCPALVDHYVEYGRNEAFNGIKLNEIYSYEFGAHADDNDEKHQTWTQSDKSVLQFYGSFRFNGANPSVNVGDNDAIWDALSQNLFENTAVIAGADLNGWGFGTKQKYYYPNGAEQLVLKTPVDSYTSDDSKMSALVQHISWQNAVAYYVIAIALGMIDSLGKNLTLRSWDGGKTWWFVFYDMDSALSLSNESADNIPETANVDTYTTKTVEGQTSELNINYFDKNGRFNAFNSKIWAIFRSEQFLYANNNAFSYEGTWLKLRRKGGALSTADKFVDLMEKQIASCGELLYDYDYYSKYIENPKNIEMLHGLRVEKVRVWLKNHLYFLDGVFEASNTSGADFEDAPYYKNTFNITNEGHTGGAIGYIPYTFRSTAPIFIRINTGNVSDESGKVTGKYFIPSYTDTVIHTAEHTSRKQTNFTTSTLLTKIDGLDGIQPVNMNTNNNAENGVLPALTNFNIAGAKQLDNNPINTDIFKYGDEGMLEHIDVSQTSFGNLATGTTSFVLNCEKLTKVKYIDISNSPVTSLQLPSSTLQYLNIRYSDIANLIMSNQSVLKTVDFTGCNKMQEIKIDNCKGLEYLSIGGASGLSVLNQITIQNCGNITSVTIENNASLKQVNINNCASLQEITISNCSSKDLSISIIGCPLKRITMSGLDNMSNIVTLPSVDMLTGVTYFNISNDFRFGGIKYGSDGTAETYNDEFVLDLSVFPLLTGRDDISLRNVSTIKYIRVKNNETEPFKLYSETLSGIGSLRRIFGHIEICNGGLFDNKKDFYLNAPLSKVDGVTPFTEPLFVSSNKYYTNVTVNTTSVSSLFRRTSCSLSDLYYFMHKCNDKVVDFSWCFAECPKIVANDTDVLNKDLFKNCTAAKSIDYIFYGTNVGGLMDNTLLSPLTNLESFGHVFSDETDIYVDFVGTNYFFPSENKIKSISYFNPLPPSSQTAMASDANFLHNLPNLETIFYSFNGTYPINFTRNGDIFTYATKVKSIESSFQNIVGYTNGVKTSVNDIFGATNIETIKDSFHFVNGGYTAFVLSIGNSFFNKVKDSLKSIEGSFNGESFIKLINYDDCDGENFPYKIFSGCTKLEKISGFFDNISGKTNTVIDFPSKEMFADCNSLKSFRYGFSNVQIPYRLVPNCFTDTTIEDFSYAFVDNYGQRQGIIPYHMFYQQAGNVITNMEGCFSSQNSKALEPFTLSAMTDEEIAQNIYVSDGGTGNMWNEFFTDGSAWFENKAKKFAEDNADLNLPSELPKSFEANEQIGSYDPLDYNCGITDTTILDRLNTSNYFCPPDLFAYCKNDSNTSISNCFSGNRYEEDWLNKGFFGRIPSVLFKPLSEITTADGVFSSMHYTPETWGISILNTYGILFPSDLLYPLSKVRSMQSLFADTNIWGGTIIHSNAFANCSSLQDISGLWDSTTWHGNVGNNTQIPLGLFNNCPSLFKVSSMFNRSNAVISQTLFTFTYNPKIYDVSNFLYESNCSGTLIKWWNNWTIASKDGCYANISSDNFSNYDECKEEAPSYFI